MIATLINGSVNKAKDSNKFHDTIVSSGTESVGTMFTLLSETGADVECEVSGVEINCSLIFT